MQKILSIAEWDNFRSTNASFIVFEKFVVDFTEKKEELNSPLAFFYCVAFHQFWIFLLSKRMKWKKNCWTDSDEAIMLRLTMDAFFYGDRFFSVCSHLCHSSAGRQWHKRSRQKYFDFRARKTLRFGYLNISCFLLPPDDRCTFQKRKTKQRQATDHLVLVHTKLLIQSAQHLALEKLRTKIYIIIKKDIRCAHLTVTPTYSFFSLLLKSTVWKIVHVLRVSFLPSFLLRFVFLNKKLLRRQNTITAQCQSPSVDRSIFNHTHSLVCFVTLLTILSAASLLFTERACISSFCYKFIS